MSGVLDQARELWLRLDPFLASSVVKTLILAAALGVVRLATSRALDRNVTALEDRRRWKVSVRNAALVVLLIGVVLIWAQELQALMLSLVAVGAAVVLAFKEVINCLSGTLVRTATGAFSVGDRVEIAGMRGDVIDFTLLTTTLMEVGPGQQTHQFTGRAVVVPNSLLLSNPVINESFTDDYLLHHFVIGLPRGADWAAAERALLEAAWAECRDYLENARSFLDQQAKRRALEPVSVDPRVSLRLEDPSRIDMVVRVAVPARRKGRVEQAILRRYLLTEGRPA